LLEPVEYLGKLGFAVIQEGIDGSGVFGVPFDPPLLRAPLVGLYVALGGHFHGFGVYDDADVDGYFPTGVGTGAPDKKGDDEGALVVHNGRQWVSEHKYCYLKIPKMHLNTKQK
jgi:hypothetical protein